METRIFIGGLYYEAEMDREARSLGRRHHVADSMLSHLDCWMRVLLHRMVPAGLGDKAERHGQMPFQENHPRRVGLRRGGACKGSFSFYIFRTQVTEKRDILVSWKIPGWDFLKKSF